MKSGALTIRWREARSARGSLRLAQRVRSHVAVADVPAMINGLAAKAHAQEFRIEWSDGSSICVHAQVLLAWASGERPDIPAILQPEWDCDLAMAAERARAVEGMRLAVAALHACGVIDGGRADDLIKRVHLALQSLPVSSAGPWRA